MPRKNAAIQRLIDRQTVFCSVPVPNGNFTDLQFYGQSDFDMVVIETEHQGFDSVLLRTSLQYLLNRKRIAEDGALIRPTPLVRVPPYTREQNQWVIKQTLDQGAMGIVLPHLDSVEGAEAAVKAARLPRPRGAAAQNGPYGVRGWCPSGAPEYWGMSPEEYYERADLWPLNPDGELLLLGIVENVEGVRNLPHILKQAKGIGAIWAGGGDLGASMGLKGDYDHPEVEAEILKILHICKDHGVPCATPAGRRVSVVERMEQGFEIVVVAVPPSLDALNSGLNKAGRGR